MLSPYQLTEPDDFSYEFVTSQEVHYQIYFLDYSAMFVDYPDVSKFIYTFNIDVISGNEKSAFTDERIGITVVEVFKKFFAKIENVIVYVCDTTDEKHYARKRKFDSWFWKYNDGNIIKEDGIAIIEGIEIINALLVQKDNPKLNEIIFAFKDLNNKVGEK